MTHNKDIAVLGMWWNNNYGAVLTYYALNKVLSDLGYTPFIINHVPYAWKISKYNNGISEKFANKYFKLTEYADRPTDLLHLNNKFDTFIVGSDQVFRYEFVKYFEDIYFLNFVQLDKKRLALGASFGKEQFTGSEEDKIRVTYLLSRFDFLSSRELDGVRVFKDTYGLEASFLLDPVFLPDISLYTDIMLEKESTATVAYYFIGDEAEKRTFVNDLATKHNITPINMRRNGNTIEGWLTDLYNAKYIVTDSFHATCFSILFNKNFYMLNNLTLQEDYRFETIKKLFPELSDNIQPLANSRKFFENYEFNIPWEKINSKLDILKKESKKLLIHALAAPKKEVLAIQQGFESLYFDLFKKIVSLDRLTYKLEQRLTR